jgi:hypothetical protein
VSMFGHDLPRTVPLPTHRYQKKPWFSADFWAIAIHFYP